MGLGEHLLIVGAGNPLMGDDGAGIRVIESLLQNRHISVEVYDCGTDLLKIGSLEKQYDDIILVDTVRTGTSPGTIHWFTQKQLLSFSNSSSAHQISLLEALALLPVMNPLFESVRFSIIGIEPETVSRTPELSQPVRTSVRFLSDLLQTVDGLQKAITRCQETVETSGPAKHSTLRG